MIEKILSISSPLGKPFDLCKLSWESTGSPDDILSVVSGLHGDHLNGLCISARLSRFLDHVTEGREPRYRLNGRVQIFPVVNVKAVESGNRLWPYDGLDMDLAFPGNEKGEASEKIAAALLRHTSDSSHALVLRTAPVHYYDAPHIQCFQPNRATRKTAGFLGLETARELNESPALRLQLLYHWAARDIAALAVSAGTAQTVDLVQCEKIFQGILNTMVKIGLLVREEDPGEDKEKKNSVRFFGQKAERKILTAAAGMFFPEIEAGDRLKKGEKIGEVRDIYSGKPLQEFTAPEDGIAITLRQYPLVYEKEPVAIILTGGENRFWPF